MNAPSEAPTIYYDADNDPDGPGGSTSDESKQAQLIDDGDNSTYKVTINSSSSKIKDGVEFRYLWDIDGNIVDNLGTMYRFQLDGQVSAPSGLVVDEVVGNQVTLTFDGIADDDFQQYEVLYSKQSPVTRDDSKQAFETQNPSDVTVTDLDDSTQYYFNIRAVDDVGNTSPLDTNEEVSATTNKGFKVTVDRAEDGVNTIKQFDGSQTMRDDDVTVYFNTDEDVGDREVSIYYDIDDTPDGKEGTNRGDRKRLASGSSTSFKAIIPSSDKEWEPGKSVEFVVQIADQTFKNGDSGPFAFQIGEGVSNEVEGFDVKDQTGKDVTLRWKSIPQDSDFETYRIYYSQDTPVTTKDQSWDKSDDFGMGAISTTQTTIDGLSPNTTYYFNILAVNEVGSEGPFTDRVSTTTSAKSAIVLSEVNFVSNNGADSFIELHALAGPIDIGGFTITDLDGSNPSFRNDTITLEAGDRALIHPHSGTTETDTTGDLNGNGLVDLFTLNLPDISEGNQNEIVLMDDQGDTLDALIYRRDSSQNEDGVVGDVSRLVPENWNGSNKRDFVITYAQSGRIFEDTPAIARKTGSFDQVLDSNSKSDWQTTTNPTPGGSNTFLQIESISIADSPSRQTHLRQEKLQILDGSKTLKPSDVREIKVVFNQKPVQHDRFRLAWDFDENPSLAGDSTSFSDETFNEETLTLTGNVNVTGDSHGFEERVMLLTNRFGGGTFS
ncbi:MAG: fibronectin type III domain-containing protein, partial [bacterium]